MANDWSAEEAEDRSDRAQLLQGREVEQGVTAAD
jgi:hypothetical protein